MSRQMNCRSDAMLRSVTNPPRAFAGLFTSHSHQLITQKPHPCAHGSPERFHFFASIGRDPASQWRTHFEVARNFQEAKPPNASEVKSTAQSLAATSCLADELTDWGITRSPTNRLLPDRVLSGSFEVPPSRRTSQRLPRHRASLFTTAAPARLQISAPHQRAHYCAMRQSNKKFFSAARAVASRVA